MSFDGFVTRAIAKELDDKLTGGKIEKIYQPESEEIVINIHAQKTHQMLYISAASSHARIHLTDIKYTNPQTPMGFCMLLRKHLQGGRIKEIHQKDSERIIELSVDTVNELGFSVNKKLIVEIMGKHSNIVLLDVNSGKIIDSIKRISIDVNRYRQLLPGQLYVYPPDQGKRPYYLLTETEIENALAEECGNTPKAFMRTVQGLSPSLAEEITVRLELLCEKENFQKKAPALLLNLVREIGELSNGSALQPNVYMDKDKVPVDFHILPLSAFEEFCDKKIFEGISLAVNFYYINKDSSNRVKQKASDLMRTLNANLDKLYLKKQRLSDDLLKAENSDSYRLKGELLTANLHDLNPIADRVTVTNYYTGDPITIQLDPRFSLSKNAQRYFKKYSKSKTAVIEKNIQLEETNKDLDYLESVLSYVENATTTDEIEELRLELVSGGYMRKRKNNYKPTKTKSEPIKYFTSNGFKVFVGKNNKENDNLTFKLAGNKDLWFHTKDIPGSHVILFTEGKNPDPKDITEAASMAAFHSKGKASENVPVDYTKVKNVKKPSGAKPGMVIFTDNKTVYVNPTIPS